MGYNIGPRVSLPIRYDAAALEKSGLDLSTTGDKALINVPFKCKVVYAACIVTTIVSGAAVVAFDRRHTAGSDGSTRTDATIANITLPDTTAVGKVIYDKAAQDSITSAAAAALITAATCQVAGGFWDTTNEECKNYPHGYLEPGMEVVVQIASGTTGKFQPVLVVDMLEETAANLANFTVTT